MRPMLASGTQYADLEEDEKTVVRHVLAAGFWHASDAADMPIGDMGDETLYNMVLEFATVRWQNLMLSGRAPMPYEQSLEWHFAAKLLDALMREDVLPDPDRGRLSLRDIRRRLCDRLGIDGDDVRDEGADAVATETEGVTVTA